MGSVFLCMYLLAVPITTALLVAVFMRKMMRKEISELRRCDSESQSFGQWDEKENKAVKAIGIAEEKHMRLCCDNEPAGERLAKAIGQMKNEYALTDRETEILTELLVGNGNRAIAGKLFISENTVKTHIHNLLQKMEVSNRIEALEKVRNAMSDATYSEDSVGAAVYGFYRSAEAVI